MTTTFGDKMRSLASRLTTKFGGGLTASFAPEATPDEYDPATGAVTNAGSPTVVPCAPVLSYRAQDIDGTTIKARDAKLLVPYSANPSFTPTVGQRVTVSGTKWSIVYVDRIDPDETPALWQLQLRPA